MQQVPIKRSYEVTIIGGGEAGCHAAIALAKMKTLDGHPIYNITLLEKNKNLMWGTSRITPGRLGEGYHYNHLETALTYQRETLSFMQHYPNCVIGKDLNKNHPLRRGRYVVMKDSKPGPSEVLEIYKELLKYYKERVTIHSDNKIWGETNDFLKLIYVAEDQTKQLREDPMAPPLNKNNEAKDELKRLINLDNVAFVVETAEELLDWKQYREDTLRELANYKNINIVTEMEVLGLEQLDNQNFVIRCKNVENQTVNFKTEYPVICAWERSEILIGTLNNISTATEETTNRLKAIITIKLPPEMLNMNSYFFCMGPYAMFSNMGNGIGKITYAPVTNMFKANASQVIPEEMKLFLNDQAGQSLKRSIAEKILNGAKTFILALANVTPDDIVDIGFGIVKTRGSLQEVDINNPLGKIGERDYGWVRKHETGSGFVVQNDAMKIVYSLKNAEETKQIINEAVYLTNTSVMISP